jgi:ankyrin repeat protein
MFDGANPNTTYGRLKPNPAHGLVAGGVRLAPDTDDQKVDADGTTALHRAVRANDMPTVQRLLRNGAAVNAATRNGVTPLLLAAINADPLMVDTLLKAGADPNASLSAGQTVLMTAARTGSAAAVKTLLAHGANVNAREQVLGETALIWAAAENHADVINVLAAQGGDVNVRSNSPKFPLPEYGDGKSGRLTVLPRGGWTPLMYAARQNSVAAVRALADAKADLNATDPDGTTALVIAVINAHYDLAEVLLAKGANPDISDSTGMTPLYAAVDLNSFPDTPGRPAPKPVGTLDTVDMVKALLRHGANPNARLKAPILVRVHDRGDGTLGEGATPLMRAAKRSDVVLMRLLLDKGADPKLTTKTGANALMFASGFGGAGRFAEYEEKHATEAEIIDAARLCLQAGADVNAVNDAGQSALHFAVTSRDDSFIRLLAGQGATLDLKDRQGRTPLDVALGVGGRGRGGAAPVVRESAAALLRQLMASRSR